MTQMFDVVVTYQGGEQEVLHLSAKSEKHAVARAVKIAIAYASAVGRQLSLPAPYVRGA